MNRLKAGIEITLNRMVKDECMVIMSAIKDNQYWTVVKNPMNGKNIIIVTGDSSEIPDKWWKCPFMDIDCWNHFLESTNNKTLIEEYTLEGY